MFRAGGETGMAAKAIPIATEHDRPYWEGAKEGRLVLQRCLGCGLFSAQPRTVCPRCHRDSFGWAEVSGRGRIHSYTIVHQTTIAGFQEELPYVVVHVQIDEEPTCYLTANLVVDERDRERLTIDLPVVVQFENRGDVALPQFRLA
jgi:uncharacterized OB-fold protein